MQASYVQKFCIKGTFILIAEHASREVDFLEEGIAHGCSDRPHDLLPAQSQRQCNLPIHEAHATA